MAFQDMLSAYQAGERETLLPTLDRAVQAGTADPRVWHLHGLVLRELDRRDRALPSLRTAASMAPGSAKIAHALAGTLLEAGLPSVDAVGRALQLAPGDREVVTGLTAAFVA